MHLWEGAKAVGMLRGAFPDAGSMTPTELLDAYEDELRTTIEDVGAETVAAQEEVDEETVEALAAGESPRIELTEAAAILAADDERPPADAIEAEARDILLLGMTTAVVDVDALSSAIDGAIEPKEIQQKVEGRHPMSLREYALLHHELESKGA